MRFVNALTMSALDLNTGFNKRLNTGSQTLAASLVVIFCTLLNTTQAATSIVDEGADIAAITSASKNAVSEACEPLSEAAQDERLLDASIQQELQTIYADNRCFSTEASSKGKPLSDNVVGPITKHWIHQALQVCPEHAKQCAQTEAKDASITLEAADSGVRPYVLLANDIFFLKTNGEVIELMRALALDASNSFVTREEAIAAIEATLAQVNDLAPALLDEYVAVFRPMITATEQRSLSPATIDLLIAEGLVDQAAVLKPLAGKAIDGPQFKKVIKNTLLDAHQKKAEGLQAVEQSAEKKAKKALDNASDEFDSKVKEIVALGEDPESLMKKLKTFGTKLLPFVEAPEAYVDKKLDDLAPPVDDELHGLMVDILLREINKHEKKKKELTEKDTNKHDKNKLTEKGTSNDDDVVRNDKAKKGKANELENEVFIIEELKKIYFNEKARLAKNQEIIEQNKKIDKENEAIDKSKQAQIEQAKKEQQGKLDASKAGVDKAANLVALATTQELRYTFRLSERIAEQLPSINADTAVCAESLVGTVYSSANALGRAVEAMLTSLDKVAWNNRLADASVASASEGSRNNETNALAAMEPKNTGHFSCKVELSTSSARFFRDSGAAEVMVARAAKPFYANDLSPIDITVLPSCTDCSAPMKGSNIGFVPYWQASSIYQEIGLPVNRPTAVDFSVFSRMAYFAIPIDGKNNDGEIDSALHLQNTHLIEDFFTTLTRYNVKRDVVLYSKNWCHWGEEPPFQPCANLGEKGANQKIKDTISGYAEKHYAFLLDKHKALADAGGISGVTFYFDDYTREVDVSNLLVYIKHFHQQMQTAISGPDAVSFNINLILGLRGLNEHSVQVAQKIEATAPNYFKKLESIFLVNDSDSELGVSIDDLQTPQSAADVSALVDEFTRDQSPIVTSILVFLNENTSPYKKILRMQIENEFSGGKRVEALLSVVPIMTRLALTDNAQEPYLQFQDDIAYLKYNFGGMGVWDLPFTYYKEGTSTDGTAESSEIDETNPSMDMFAYLLKKDYGDQAKNYLDYSQVGIVGQFLMSDTVRNKVDVCGEVCPKRHFYGKLFIALLIFNLIVALLWRTHCKSRVLIKRTQPARKILQLAVVICFLALLGCDPAWQQNWVLIVTAMLISVGVILIYRLISSGYETEG